MRLTKYFENQDVKGNRQVMGLMVKYPSDRQWEIEGVYVSKSGMSGEVEISELLSEAGVDLEQLFERVDWDLLYHEAVIDRNDYLRSVV